MSSSDKLALRRIRAALAKSRSATWTRPRSPIFGAEGVEGDPDDVLAYLEGVEQRARVLGRDVVRQYGAVRGPFRELVDEIREIGELVREHVEPLRTRVMEADATNAREVVEEVDEHLRGFESAWRQNRFGEAFGAEPAPHTNEWWVSTDDVLDYAEWLDKRVAELRLQYNRWKGDPATVQKAAQWGESQDWFRWEEDWNAFVTELRASEWARVNAWDRVKVKHSQLREMRDRAVSMGLPNVPDIGDLPTDPDVGGGATSALESVALAGFAVAAVLLLSRR